MSNFYVNSVKRKMKFQKLDLQSMQNNDEDSLSNVENLSPKDEIRQEESNLREEAISDLKFKLHNNFSHILTDSSSPNENHKINENHETLNSQENKNRNKSIVPDTIDKHLTMATKRRRNISTAPLTN